ncbi:MAG: c-type cytochrome biogenesis protein CcmI [Nitrosomonas sp.]|nr:c-type cytochrome biogenesis protein CcmI [Nitrosomonas sp.]MDP1951583.1 c-type cytochrome biogenesis protein CcmI [Nitrosomonas sp.]
MTSFWIIAGIFIVVALLFILPTLLRNREDESKSIDPDDANISVYRDQLAELKADLDNDILSHEQYEKSRQELQHRMLQDIPEKRPMKNTVQKKSRNIATSSILTLAIPLSAVFLYMTLGDTRGLLPQAQLANATQMQHAKTGETEVGGHAEFTSVVDNLVMRLKSDPEDIEGWVMLARTYAIMNRFEDASNTYAKLIELVPDSPQLLSDYADVLAMANQGGLAGKPTEMIHEALRIDPEYPKALALAGTVEFEQKRFNEAAEYWERLLAVIPVDSQLANSVTESIADARSLASNNNNNVGLSTEPQGSIVAQDKKATAAISSNDPTTDAGTGTSISGTVTLSQSLASKASASDTLFIYARAETGPKMPLAILRLNVNDLPTSFSLNDEMAMTPTMKISSFPKVVVEARISKSGQAVPARGDLQGFSHPVKLGEKNIAIVIDQQVP